MQRTVTKEKFLFDDVGKVIGKEIITEYYSDFDLKEESKIIDAEEIKDVAV